MKSCTLVIAPDVLDQVREQALYIARDSIENALSWEDRVIAAMNGLTDFYGHALDSETGKRLGYPVRKLVFERMYLIHYHVDEAASIVRIVQFRHGARLPIAEEP